jgi:hypothetical protein
MLCLLLFRLSIHMLYFISDFYNWLAVVPGIARDFWYDKNITLNHGWPTFFIRGPKFWPKKLSRPIFFSKVSLVAKKLSNFSPFIANFYHNFSLCVYQKFFKGHCKGPGGPKMARGPRVGHPCLKLTKT